MILLVPAIRVAFDLPSGATLLAAIIVLAVMILPSIVSVSETALRAVPREYEEASLALGALSLIHIYSSQILVGPVAGPSVSYHSTGVSAFPEGSLLFTHFFRSSRSWHPLLRSAFGLDIIEGYFMEPGRHDYGRCV